FRCGRARPHRQSPVESFRLPGDVDAGGGDRDSQDDVVSRARVELDSSSRAETGVEGSGLAVAGQQPTALVEGGAEGPAPGDDVAVRLHGERLDFGAVARLLDECDAASSESWIEHALRVEAGDERIREEATRQEGETGGEHATVGIRGEGEGKPAVSDLDGEQAALTEGRIRASIRAETCQTHGLARGQAQT